MEIKGQHWLIHTIVIHPMTKLKEPDEFGRLLKTNHYQKHVLKQFNYPSWISKKYDWYIRLWFSKMQVRFPRHHLSLEVYGYWPDADSDIETQKKRQISAAKGQISKVLSVMAERRKELSKQLFQDEANDPVMVACRIKLEEKKFKLNQLILE